MTKRHPVEKIFMVIATVFVMAFFLIPIFWLITTSFKFGREAFAIPPKWFTFDFTLKNYTQLLESSKTLMFVKNSLIISVFTTILSLLLGVPAGYAIARSRSRLLNTSSYFFLIILMIPPVAMLIPFYLIMRDMSSVSYTHLRAHET